MSLSPAADYMKCGTEHIFTTQAVIFFLFKVPAFQNIQFKCKGINEKKETTLTTRQMFENENTSRCLCKKYHKKFISPYRFKPQIEMDILL
jgi:hypothetical protein